MVSTRVSSYYGNRSAGTNGFIVGIGECVGPLAVAISRQLLGDATGQREADLGVGFRRATYRNFGRFLCGIDGVVVCNVVDCDAGRRLHIDCYGECGRSSGDGPRTGRLGLLGNDAQSSLSQRSQVDLSQVVGPEAVGIRFDGRRVQRVVVELDRDREARSADAFNQGVAGLRADDPIAAAN